MGSGVSAGQDIDPNYHLILFYLGGIQFGAIINSPQTVMGYARIKPICIQKMADQRLERCLRLL